MQIIFEFNLNTKNRPGRVREVEKKLIFIHVHVKQSCEWNNNKTISGISEYMYDNYSYTNEKLT